MTAFKEVLGVLGGIAFMWWVVIRGGATVVDIFQRWRAARNGDPNAWN